MVAPLGLLDLSDAYMAWQLVSEVLIAAAVWILLKRLREPRHVRMFVPLVLGLLFFGPVYLSLQIGALGAFTLAIVVASIHALDSRRMLLGGILLSLTLLKPPQGLPLVLLACVWLLSRREWKSLLGLGAGAVLLALIGMLRDPLWPSKFATAGQAVLDRTLGVQSNALGLAFLACSGDNQCAWLLGGGAAVVLLLVTGAYLHRRSASLTSWEAFNLIIPTAFVATPYLWSYDQILYIVPVVWIVLALINKTNSYLPAFGFMIVLVVVSLLALLTQANTRSDVTSLLTTFIVVACVVALRSGGRSAGAAAREA